MTRPLDTQPVAPLATAAALEPSELLVRAQSALDRGRWAEGVQLFGLASQRQPDNPGAWHNLGVCLLGLGRWAQAEQACRRALHLSPGLWQSELVRGRACKALGEPVQAGACFERVLRTQPANGQARIELAELCMNVFGQPLAAQQLVQPLLGTPEHGEDAQLTTLMAGLYDRDTSALVHNERVLAFSAGSLHLDPRGVDFLPEGHTTGPSGLPLPSQPGWQELIGPRRARVGIISPLFCASPVYFMTIAGWRHVARGCELVVLNRGHKSDWASEVFRGLAHEWHDVQDIDAVQLAARIYGARLDVLYDLGGWMDPVALRALSLRPARQMFKWVGGQSVSTGLSSFDGWIGDSWQSPSSSQHLYTEPLVNVPGGYASYTPPHYLPTPPATRSDVPVVFSNPAKLSRAFLAHLKELPGKKRLVHQNYRYPQARAQVLGYLSPNEVEFVAPEGHRQALEVLAQHRVMIDTFPYSSGLTAQEALALGVQVRARAGTLFCERHCARLVTAGPAPG